MSAGANLDNFIDVSSNSYSCSVNLSVAFLFSIITNPVPK